MKETQACERTISVPSKTPALKKIIPRKLAPHLKSLTVIGEESETGGLYYVKVRMVFAALMTLFPKRKQGLQRLRNRILRQQEQIQITLRQCKEINPAFP